MPNGAWFGSAWWEGSWWASDWWAGGGVQGGGGGGPWTDEMVKRFHREKKEKEINLRRALTFDEEEAMVLLLIAAEL